MADSTQVVAASNHLGNYLRVQVGFSEPSEKMKRKINAIYSLSCTLVGFVIYVTSPEHRTHHHHITHTSAVSAELFRQASKVGEEET